MTELQWTGHRMGFCYAGSATMKTFLKERVKSQREILRGRKLGERQYWGVQLKSHRKGFNQEPPGSEI